MENSVGVKAVLSRTGLQLSFASDDDILYSRYRPFLNGHRMVIAFQCRLPITDD